ncbi:ATP-binding cassette domain-containing protein, partial [Curtobacterium sp. B18]
GTWLGGQIIKDGEEIKVANVQQAIEHGIGYVSEDRKALGLNLLDTVKRSTVAADLPKISKAGVVDSLEEYNVAEKYRKMLRTKVPTVEENVGKLSGGNQQKVVLSKWMFTDPDILILDEPTRGIDVGAKFEIYGIIQQLAAEGKGIILISSELPELLGLSDRIYTIFEGQITADIPSEQADPETLMRSMTSARKGALVS